VVDEDRSEPKLAVANEVKLEVVRVEVSVEVVWWEVLVDFGRISTSAFIAVELTMVDIGIACNIAAMERALDGE